MTVAALRGGSIMQISFTGRQMEISPTLRQYTEKRLRKLSRLLRDGTDIHVILTAEKHRRTAEITLNLRDHTLVGMEESSDALSSINGALSKLKRQTVRFLQRRRTRKRRPKPISAVLLNVLASSNGEREDRQILETQRVPLKFLTLEEAVTDADMRRRGIVVFRNPTTDRVNVLYRREGGNLTLIEPEP
jgi:ribosome hibernation promoting factor